MDLAESAWDANSTIDGVLYSIAINGGQAGISTNVGGDGEYVLGGRGRCDDEDCGGGRVYDDEGCKAEGGGCGGGDGAVCVVGGRGCVVIGGDG
ncbi:conserved hypothetical protein [Ricinus communis]|uniref:Uncharacterized protein n=1 Tax=Ricinus communis TaxID=3988 RepID=B9S0R7_RICCO|nr:conserved hypothetical protein [Ricinus communis]